MLRQAALVVVLLGALGGTADAGKSTRRRCPKHGYVENSQLILYTSKADDGSLDACVKATGHSQTIAFGPIPGTLEVKGRFAGVAQYACYDDDDPCDTVVVAVDPRRESRNNFVVPADRHHISKVGSLGVSTDGELAWISCPVKSLRPLAHPSRGPQCNRAGAKDKVYAQASFKARRVKLDSGRAVDPTSLRVRGGKVTWVHDGHRRAYRLSRLPGANAPPSA